MKIIFTEDEMMEWLKRVLTANVTMVTGMKIKEVEGRGYPLREFVITLEKEGE